MRHLEPLSTKLRLRCPVSKLAAYAACYPLEVDADVEIGVAPEARRRGFLSKPQFLRLAGWKTPRSRPRCEKNDAAFVEEVTRNVLASRNERFKIESLRLLQGVDWPTASVILHFCDEQPYPVLDVRALWSVGVPRPRYGFEFWSDYVAFTRALAAKARLSMRTLDRALWQYSKEKQA